MSERDQPERPRNKARTKAEKLAREARLAAAMRENLRKRKQQQRGRQHRSPDRGVKPV